MVVQQGFEEMNCKFEQVDQTNERIDRLYTNVGAFFHPHQKLDLELTVLRGYYQNLDERLTKLETART